MSKPQFTFKNYLKEIKKCWIFIAVLTVLGAAGGAAYSFMKPTTYTASANISVYNSTVNTGPVSSPYAQISELLMSEELVGNNLEEYTVKEKPFGVFEITATSADADKAVSTVNTVMSKADTVITYAFEDAKNYQTTTLSRASEATPTTTMKKRAISAAIIAAGSFVVALIAVFIRFDYIAEK